MVVSHSTCPLPVALGARMRARVRARVRPGVSRPNDHSARHRAPTAAAQRARRPPGATPAPPAGAIHTLSSIVTLITLRIGGPLPRHAPPRM